MTRCHHNMESSGLDLSKILKMVTDNPAMLQTALSFAGKLKDNMGQAPQNNTVIESPKGDTGTVLPVMKEKENAGNKTREDERRLLLALRPYLNETRQDKIDFVLKILQLLELAGSLGLNFDNKTKGAGPHDV